MLCIRLVTNGSNYEVLHQFGNDAIAPNGNLLVAGSTLYGTTTFGGSSKPRRGLLLSVAGRPEFQRQPTP